MYEHSPVHGDFRSRPRAVKILSRTPNRVIETSCGNRWLENSTDAVGRTLRPVVTDGPLLPIELYHLTAR